MLLSDFVQAELASTGIKLSDFEVVKLDSDEQWNFFNDLRKAKPGLGAGELGALTVARFRNATLLTNDKPARQMAETVGVAYSGGIGVLECCCETGKLSGKEAVALLDNMITAGARISEDLVANFRELRHGGAIEAETVRPPRVGCRIRNAASEPAIEHRRRLLALVRDM